MEDTTLPSRTFSRNKKKTEKRKSFTFVIVPIIFHDRKRRIKLFGHTNIVPNNRLYARIIIQYHHSNAT